MIEEFSRQYRFLSNFYIEPDGTHVEGEYQSAKCANPSDIRKFNGLSPARAKRLGRNVQLRSDWDSIRVEVMERLVWQKFVDHPTLRKMLLDTEESPLVEVNYWDDTFWGVCRGIGKNHLGKILMKVRKELKV